MLSALVAAPLATLPVPLWALPATQTALNNQVASASSGVTITSVSGTQALISATGTNSVIKWNDFGDAANMTILAGDTLTYSLPGATSSVLNMVTSTGAAHASSIAGTITSNGGFYLLNPNGITVNGTGKITANTVALSTIPEAEYYFLANGVLSYVGTSTAAVTLQPGATVTAASGTGNVFIAGQSAALAGTIDGGAVSVNAQNGTVILGSGGNLVVGDATAKSSSLTVTVGSGAGNAIQIGDAVANSSVTVVGKTASLTTSSNNAITQVGTGQFSVGTGSDDSTLTLNAGTGGVTLTSANDNAGGKTLNVNVTAGATSITSGADKLAVGGSTAALTVAGNSDTTLNALTVTGNLAVSSTAGKIASGGAVTLSSGKSVTLTTAGKDISYKSTNDADFSVAGSSITQGAGGALSITSVNGNVVLPAVTSKSLNITAAGSISQVAASAIVANSGGSTLTAGNSITLTNTDMSSVAIVNAPNGATITDPTALTIGSGTAATGAVTITAAGIAFGGAAGDTISIAGDFAGTTTGNANITEANDSTTITGKLTLTAGTGNVVLSGSTGNSRGLKNQFGQVNVVSATNVTVFEQTGLNLGAISAAGNLVAYSATAITNSGQLKITGTTTVGAGTAAALGPINLDFTAAAGSGNQIGGAISVIDDINLLNGTATAPVAPIGNALVGSIAVVNELPTTFSIPTNIYGTSSAANVSLTTTGASGITVNTLNTTGTLTLVSNTGAITATNASNAFSTVNVTSAGGIVNVTSPNTLLVNATLTGGAASTATFGSTGGNLNIGSFSSTYNAAPNSIILSGKSGISDTVAGISIYGGISLTSSNGGVTITKSGHNFGGITVDTSGKNGNISIVEGGTLKVVGMNAAKGAIVLTSTNGSILEPVGGTGVINSGAATFNASNGGVVLLDGGVNKMTGTVTASALTDSTIKQTTANALALGNVAVTAGNLTVDVSGSGKDLTQASGTTINAYGATSFTATGASNITLTNSGNNFGALTLSSGAGNISITEKGTMNLVSVAAGANFTATSETANIIDSGSGTIIPTGTAAFSAPKGSVTLGLTGSNYGTVTFNTAGNVSIVDGAGDITLGASTVGGDLTVSNSTGNILQSGVLNVTGNSAFLATAAASSVNLGNTSNSFGPVRFIVGTGGGTLAAASNFALRGGSVATGAVNITTNGNFSTTGIGGSSFTNNLTISATGTIIPSAGSLLVTGTFTVFASGTKDLSALSKSGNLAGHDPINLGTGAYVAPSP